jgi:uroporphyrinogen-III synthase
MRPAHLIVTRPREQAGPWVDALRALGVDALALPLIEIEPVPDDAPLRAAWQGLGRCTLAMFVSANAVTHFFAARPPGASWPAGTLAGSTGRGTTAALRGQGVPEGAIVEPGPGMAQDSESLWAHLQAVPWAGRRALVVRGEEGRDWLADRLRAAGAEVDFLAAYRRRPPRLDEAGQALLAAARAAPAAHAWLFSSSEAVRHLAGSGGLAPHADWSAATALATHPRIAAAATRAGFGQVVMAEPSPRGVAQALARLQSAAP